jgi:3-oxo-5alpha-steroid 4-dehydrogenase
MERVEAVDPADEAIGPIEPVDASEIDSWHDEADVVIVGLGCAGACAAIEAAAAGASVLILERAGAGGGTSAMAGGILYLGGGTPIQEACGFSDTPDEMFAYLVAACGPGVDEAKARIYCDESVAHYHWLVEHGVPFKAEYYPEHDREPPTDAGLIYTGGENAAPFDRIATPAPRGHHPRYPDAAGGFLMERLLAAVDVTAPTVRTDTRVDRLVVDGDRVVGVMAREAGRERAVRSHRGVVLTAGGFTFNRQMLRHHCRPATRCLVPVGTDNDDGSAIRMGMGVGAATRAMGVAECAVPIMPPRTLARGVLIDGEGERFLNEDTYTGRIGQHALYEAEGQAFWLVDEALYEAIDGTNVVGMRVEWVAESVEQLAGEIGVPPDALARTVERYNGFVADGVDADFGKAAEFLVPMEPPLGAIDLRVDHAIYAPFTLGGLDTDVDGRVIHGDGSPVPGLFAAGRTTAGLAVGGYASGISLGDGTFFGRRAGRAAAAA